MPTVTLYSRPGCHLCEEVKEQLEALQEQFSFSIEEVNIDEDPALRSRYRDDIPVVAVGGQEAFKHRLDPAKFKDLLLASSDE